MYQCLNSTPLSGTSECLQPVALLGEGTMNLGCGGCGPQGPLRFQILGEWDAFTWGGRGRRERHSRDLYPLHNLPDWLPSASGIRNISNQIKVAENTPDLSGLAGGSARVKRLRLQCLSKV